jgi:hypothetical protein
MQGLSITKAGCRGLIVSRQIGLLVVYVETDAVAGTYTVAVHHVQGLFCFLGIEGGVRAALLSCYSFCVFTKVASMICEFCVWWC